MPEQDAAVNFKVRRRYATVRTRDQAAMARRGSYRFVRFIGLRPVSITDELGVFSGSV